MTEFRGSRDPAGRRFAVVVSRFNEEITSALLAGARDAFRGAGAGDADVDIAWVPGAFDIPLVARRLAASGGYAGVVALGAVIRGETSHHEVVARAAAEGLGRPRCPAIQALVAATAARSTPWAMPRPSSIHSRSSVARLPVALRA